MTSKVVSFQIVQGFEGPRYIKMPEVVALCQDGSLWVISLEEFKGPLSTPWKRMTPEIRIEQDFWDNGNGQLG